MIQSILNRQAKKITGVNATLYLKVKGIKFTITFGRGNPGSPDYLEFKTLRSLMSGKPTSSNGYGHAILAFKEMMGK